MKKFRMIALVLAVMLVVPMIASCGGTQEKGDPYTFVVTAISKVPLDDQNNVIVSTEETEEDYEQVLRPATNVPLYREAPADGSAVQITLGEVIEKYVDQTNNDFVFDDATRMYTKLEGVSRQASVGTSWDIQVDGTSTALSTVVSTSAEITLVYGK